MILGHFQSSDLSRKWASWNGPSEEVTIKTRSLEAISIIFRDTFNNLGCIEETKINISTIGCDQSIDKFGFTEEFWIDPFFVFDFRSTIWVVSIKMRRWLHKINPRISMGLNDGRLYILLIWWKMTKFLWPEKWTNRKTSLFKILAIIEPFANSSSDVTSLPKGKDLTQVRIASSPSFEYIFEVWKMKISRKCTYPYFI